ncbi:hypothetical protein KKG90_03210 [Candidatus Bipolaricaulota bacterium]|nr:hypothetical protein [Candidatus Bipolaricaulota bacterium]
MNEIERTQQRTRSYWFSDGIAELVGGIAMALVGFLMVASERTGVDMLATMALLAMILLFPASAQLVRLMKDRITHTRTGYVKYPRPTMSKRRKIIILSLLISVASAVFVALWGGEYTLDGGVGKVFFVGAGTGMAVAFAVRAVRLRLPRLFASAVVLAAMTTASGFADFGFVEGMGLLLAVLGSTSVITGGVTLAIYISRHPKAPLETL